MQVPILCMWTGHWSGLGVSVMWRNEVGRVVLSPLLMGKWETVIILWQWFGLLIQTSPLFTAYPGKGVREKEAEQACLLYAGCKKWMGLMQPLFLLRREGAIQSRKWREASCGLVVEHCLSFSLPFCIWHEWKIISSYTILGPQQPVRKGARRYRPLPFIQINTYSSVFGRKDKKVISQGGKGFEEPYGKDPKGCAAQSM